MTAAPPVATILVVRSLSCLVSLAVASVLAVGCSTAPPPAPVPATYSSGVDPRVVDLLTQYARSVEALHSLVAAQAQARDASLVARRLELDALARGRLHETVSADRRVRELSAAVLATGKSDAERSRVALAVADLAQGRGDRTAPTLPAHVRESEAFRSFVEALARSEALHRDVLLLEAQIGAVDAVLATARTHAPPFQPVPGPRSIDPRL